MRCIKTPLTKGSKIVPNPSRIGKLPNSWLSLFCAILMVAEQGLRPDALKGTEHFFKIVISNFGENFEA